MLILRPKRARLTGYKLRFTDPPRTLASPGCPRTCTMKRIHSVPLSILTVAIAGIAFLALAGPTSMRTSAPNTADCELYPLALHSSTLAGATVGMTLTDILNGTQPGNFGWLSWDGNGSPPALVTMLTPPGNSYIYTNPFNGADHVVSTGDWVQGNTGVSNSSNVRDALDELKNLDIIIPVWNQTQGNGGNTKYRVTSFARVRITDYRLSGQSRISALFLGSTSCPILPTPTSSATPTDTSTPTATHTAQPTATDTPDPTATDTLTPLPTDADTPEPTATDTAVPTATDSPTPSSTDVDTPEPTVMRTATPTATDTPTLEPTATDTPSPTVTDTDTPTATAVTPSLTPTPRTCWIPTATATVDPDVPTATPTEPPSCSTPAPNCPRAWSLIQLPVGQGHGHHLSDVEVIADDDVWALGYSRDSSGTFHPYGSHWDGCTWGDAHLPEGVTIYYADALSSRDVWALGNRRPSGINLVLRWDGTRWNDWASELLRSQLSGLENNVIFTSFSAVAALGESDVWVVGENVSTSNGAGQYHAVAAHWDGCTWTAYPITFTGLKDHLVAVAAVASDDVWAVGGTDNSAGAWAAHWDGVSWRTMAVSPQPESPWVTSDNLLGVTAVSQDDVWAVGHYAGPGGCVTLGLTMHWDGNEWIQVEAPPSQPQGTGTQILNCVTALSTNDVWAAGWTSGAGGSTAPRLLHWDGSSWSVVARPPVPDPFDSTNPYGQLLAIDVDQDGNVWSVGYHGRERVSDDPLDHVYEDPMAYRYARSCAVATSSPPATRTPAPTPPCSPIWSSVPAPVLETGTTGELHAVTIVGGNQPWTVGSGTTNGNAASLAARWVDGNWSNVSTDSLAGQMLHDVSGLGSDDVWAVGEQSQSGLALAQHWNGAAWQAVSLPVTRWPGLIHNVNGASTNSVVTIAPDDAWIVGTIVPPGMLTGTTWPLALHWDGSTWRRVGTPGISQGVHCKGVANELKAIDGQARDDVWAVGSWQEQNQQPQPLILHWDGNEWSIVATPNLPRGGRLHGVSMESRTDVWAAGEFVNDVGNPDGLLLHWDGMAWTQVALPTFGLYPSLHDIVSVGAHSVWAVGRYYEPAMSRYLTLAVHWNGASWTRAPNQEPAGTQFAEFRGVAGASSSHVWAAGHYYDATGSHSFTARYFPPCVIPSPTVTPAVTNTPSLTPTPRTCWVPTHTATLDPNVPTASPTPRASCPTPPPSCARAWSFLQPPVGQGPDHTLSAVEVIAEDDVWALGESSSYNGAYSLRYKYGVHWDGCSWSDAQLPDGALIRDAAAVASGNMWAVGWTSFNSQPIVLRWDGTRWNDWASELLNHEIIGANNVTWVNVQGVAALEDSDVWVVADVGVQVPNAGREDQVVASHWDGCTWTAYPISFGGLDAHVNAVAAVASDDAWAAGSSGTGSWIAHWDGASWQTTLVSPYLGQLGNAGDVLNDIAIVSADDIWAVGRYYDPRFCAQRSLTIHWNGDEWTHVIAPQSQPSGTGIDELHSVTALTSENVWAAGSTSPRRPLLMHWDGSTWSIVERPLGADRYDSNGNGGVLFAIDADPAGDVWAVGQFDQDSETAVFHREYGPLVYRYARTCAGVTSTPQATPISAPAPPCSHEWSSVAAPELDLGQRSELRAVAIVGSDEPWTVGSGTVNGSPASLSARWMNGRWSTVAPTNLVGEFASDVSGISTNDVWVVGLRSRYSPAMAQHWNGSQWVDVTLPVTRWSGSVQDSSQATTNAIVTIAADDALIVGAIQPPGFMATAWPLALHWDGEMWRRARYTWYKPGRTLQSRVQRATGG